MAKGFVRALCGALCVLAAASGCSAATSKTWQSYVSAYTKKAKLPLPDWSWAGYHYSEKAIPTITGPRFDVTKYGAKGDGKTYNDKQVQAAINAAKKAGGGVVYFPKGKYLFGASKNKPAQKTSVLRIDSSNIVLRGAGASTSGTVLVLDKTQTDVPFLEIKAVSPGGSSKIAVLTATAPINSLSIKVDTVTNLKNEKCFRIRYGDTKTYKAKGTKYVEAYYGKSTYIPRVWQDIKSIGVVFFEHHCIKRIDSKTKTVYLTEPTRLDFVKHSTPFEIWKYKPIQEVGVEDILFKGSWDSVKARFCHHCSPLDDWGWTALWLHYVRNFWIRNVEFRDWNQGIRLYQTSHGTIRDVVYSGKAGHHSIESRQSYGTLIMDNVDKAGTHHGPSVSFFDEGTVYLRHQMTPGQRIDCHASNPTSTLFDNVVGGILSGSGGNIKDYPNHGGALTLWNFKHRGSTAAEKKQQYNFWPKSPDTGKTGGTSFVKPNIIGLHGDSVKVDKKSTAILESLGTAVEPKSLFLAQLCLRIGQSKCTNGVPKALVARSTSTSSKQETDTNSDSSSSGSNALILIGIAVGCLALVALLAVTAYVHHKRAGRKGQVETTTNARGSAMPSTHDAADSVGVCV